MTYKRSDKVLSILKKVRDFAQFEAVTRQQIGELEETIAKK